MKQWLLTGICCLPLGIVHAADVGECKLHYLDTDRHFMPVPKAKVGKLNIETNPIFDETAPDTIALHRFANWLHINTKAEVIAERLPFAEGDSITTEDLAEAERIIRSQHYIRDAKVSISGECNEDDPAVVKIQTWDNWSLIPTVSFSHKGGENKFSVGMKEDNLLGLGIRTRFKYNTDEQRSGYQLTVKSATPMLMEHSTLLFDFLDNDDGNLLNIEFDRPFYDARSENMFFATYLSDDKVVDVFQNGGIRNTFVSQSHHYEVATGWQFDSNLLYSQRFSVGLVDEEYRFSPDLFILSTPELLPQDRRFQYVWLGLESLQRDFRVMSDIYLIDQAEDINLGWHYQAKLGLDFANDSEQSGMGYRLQININKGWEVNDGLLLVSAAGEGTFNQSQTDHYLLSATAEYFKRYNRLLGMYSRLSANTENNSWLDLPQSVGDETGVRGYPLQYQHGEHSVSGSLEARLYSGYNIYKILDVGFAGFVDVGRAWGGDEGLRNETDQVLSSVGIGARLYSNRSSHKSVIHIDLVKPLTSSENVDNWAWRAQVKQSF
jgi:outer membrane protein assembly factor BamA